MLTILDVLPPLSTYPSSLLGRIVVVSQPIRNLGLGIAKAGGWRAFGALGARRLSLQM
jgi:hypothetical protein